MDIERALDECLREIEQNGATVEECLARYPDQREELASLLAAAVRLRVAPEVRLSEAARRTMRERITRLPVPVAQRRTNWIGAFLPRRAWRPAVVLATLLLALLVVGAGLALASAESLPHDPLYPVKRALEGAALALMPTQEGDAYLRLAFAGRRLDEAIALARRGETGGTQTLVAEYRHELEAVLAFVTGGVARGADMGPLAMALREQLARQHERLAAARAQMPPGVRPAIGEALATVQQMEERAAKILEGRPTLPSSAGTPGGIPAPSVAPTLSPLPGLPELTPVPPAMPTPPGLPPLPTIIPTPGVLSPTIPLPLPAVTLGLPLPTVTASQP
ncbi:MAG: DUF5667 domain-containing protein [Chloroflexota bacterium]